MGNRAQIRLRYENGNIYLYSHWDGRENLYEKLLISLMRGKDRWDDPEYLARIIFEDMIGDATDKLLGYGIGLEEYEDLNSKIIKVDLVNQTVDGKKYNKILANALSK